VKLKNCLYIFVILVVCLFTAGCDKYTKYKVLTVFFTGVPHPEKQPELSMTVEKANEPSEGEPTKTVAVSSIHGPYAAGMCYLCHEVSTTAGLKTRDRTKKPVQQTKRFDSALPGRLLAPVQELCIECHTSKSSKSAFSRDLWIHGPVSSGTCTICHSPHATQYRYMLRNGNSNQMCAMCHEEGFISNTEDHREGKDCITCHNAHLGKSRFLLKKDFDEVF